MRRRRSTDRCSVRSVLWTICLALVGVDAAAALGIFSKKPYSKGEIIQIEGRIADDLGNPLPGVTIVLEASRQRDDPKARDLFMGEERPRGVLEVLGESDADGRFRIDWSWDRHHDSFALVAAAPQRANDAGGERWELARRDISERFQGEKNVVVDLTLPASEELAWLRKFLLQTASADEQRIFRTMGRPDRVDAAQAEYDPDSSWWYFETGVVYRFRDGALEAEDRFEPVTAPPPPAPEDASKKKKAKGKAQKP